MNTPPGYKALVAHHDNLVEALKKGASWQHDIRPSISLLVPDLANDPHEALRRYDLEEPGEEAGQRETEARNQLAQDLLLSTNVYGQQKVTPPSLEGAFASSMTLGDEPPPVHFGFLRPSQTSVPSTLGIRLLMQEWEPGTSVQDYRFKDPYETDKEPAPRRIQREKRNIPASQPAPTQTWAPTQTQTQPPTVVAAKSLVPVVLPVRELPMPAATQPVRTMSFSQPMNDSVMDFQDRMPSTQVVAGPHGGRPTGKKKPKKRMGGF